MRRLAIELSHPDFLVDGWWRRRGEAATRQLLLANNRPKPLHLLAFRDRGGRELLAESLIDEGCEVEASSLSPLGLKVRSGSPLQTEAYRRGDFYVQDEAARPCAAAAPGERVSTSPRRPAARPSRPGHRAARRVRAGRRRAGTPGGGALTCAAQRSAFLVAATLGVRRGAANGPRGDRRPCSGTGRCASTRARGGCRRRRCQPGRAVRRADRGTSELVRPEVRWWSSPARLRRRRTSA